MKKRNLLIVSLLVLSLSVVLLGCPPEDEEEGRTLDGAKAIYNKISNATLVEPTGCTFSDYYTDSEEDPTLLAVIWSGGSEEKYDAYETKLSGAGVTVTPFLNIRNARALVTNDRMAVISVGGKAGAACFTLEGGSDESGKYDLPANAIYLTIKK